MAHTAPFASTLAADAAMVTELAAIASWAQIGRGDEKHADQLAVDAMRNALNSLDIDGKIVIGEGERDEAPMLYIGEKVGTGCAAGMTESMWAGAAWGMTMGMGCCCGGIMGVI